MVFFIESFVDKGVHIKYSCIIIIAIVLQGIRQEENIIQKDENDNAWRWEWTLADSDSVEEICAISDDGNDATG